MLIPSIDLKGGRVVQLIQGKRPAIETDDIDAWVEKFATFPLVQLIDLDSAMGSGTNERLIRDIAPAVPCRWRDPEHSAGPRRAQLWCRSGDRRVVVFP